ncbi:hypothetical protein, partial [Staphylococcus epidermidis]|uniref:hypothetical protein n=1 Tax=Staphylococcus epidermidis TaxID=1282 RepID=UPI001C930A84
QSLFTKYPTPQHYLNLTHQQLQNLQNQLAKPFILHPYKPLPQINPQQLSETTINPQTPTLITLQLQDELPSSKPVTTFI